MMKTVAHLISQLTDACHEAKSFAREASTCEHDMFSSLYDELSEHELAQAHEIIKYMDRYTEHIEDEDKRRLCKEAYEYAKCALADAEADIKAYNR